MVAWTLGAYGSGHGDLTHEHAVTDLETWRGAFERFAGIAEGGRSGSSPRPSRRSVLAFLREKVWGSPTSAPAPAGRRPDPHGGRLPL